MKVKFSEGFVSSLIDQVDYIAKDKPSAAKKFKNDLLNHLKKDLSHPFNYRKSIYFDNELIRDYIFKGYTIVFKVDLTEKTIYAFGFIKYKELLK